MYKFKQKQTKKSYNFTIIYLDVCNDLNIDLVEYVVLDALRYHTNKGIVTESISQIAKNVEMSRTTIYNNLVKLHKENHVDYDTTTSQYVLHYDIKDRFNDPKLKQKYIKVYHDLRKKMKLSVLEYALLYMFYSLSRNSNKVPKSTYANAEYYIRELRISERHYYTTKNKLCSMKLIKNNYNQVSIEDTLVNDFERLSTLFINSRVIKDDLI